MGYLHYSFDEHLTVTAFLLMKILAIETSSKACSAALLDGEPQDFSCIERFEIAPRQHTQLILPMIDSILDEAGYDLKQMDALAFGRGPGAFTGVRVATGVVQAISYGADLPVAQISSLAALAQACYDLEKFEKVLVANDARMDEIYFGAYELNSGFMSLSGEEQVIKPEQLRHSILNSANIDLNDQWYASGDGWTVYAEQLEELASQCQKSQGGVSMNLPRAKNIAFLAMKEVKNDNLVAAEQVSPVYLRDNVAKKAQQATTMV